MRALIQLCLLVLLILSMCAPAYAQDDPFMRAEQALQVHDYSTALELYTQLDADHPNSQLFTWRLVQVYEGLGQWADAAAAYERLAKLRRLELDERMAYGDALKAAGRLDEAVIQYKLVMDAEAMAKPAPPALEVIAPSAPPAADPMAEPAPNLAESKPVQAEASVRTMPVPQVNSVPAEHTYSVNRVESAGSNQFHQPGVFMQGRSEDDGGGRDNEAPPATRAPDEVLVQARRYFELEQYARAIEQYEMYAGMTGGMDRSVRLEYADSLREADRLDEAEAEFNRLLHANADDVDAKVGLAKTLAKRGELEDAMYLLDQIYQSEEALLKAYLARAYAYLINGYTQEAWTDLGEAMAIDPNHPGVLKMEQELRKHESEISRIIPDDPSLRADALFGQGQYEQARGMYEQMVRRDPANPRAWLRLATIYRWEGDYGDSAEAYETYLKGHLDDYEARLRYAQVLYFDDRLDEAEDELESLMNDTDTPVEIYEETLVVYGAVLNAMGRSKEAAELYRQALVYAPHDVSARSQYAGVLASMHNYEDAIAQYEAAMREDPGNGEVKLGLARTYSWQGNQGKAQKYYNQIGLTDPYYGSSRIGLAYSHLANGDRSQALALAAEAEKYDPNNPELASLRAQLSNTGTTTIAEDWRQSHDNDDNDTRSMTTRLTIPLDARGTALGLEYEDTKLDNTTTGLVSSGIYTRASLLVPVTDEMKINLRGGYLDISNDDDPSITEWTHGVSLSYQASDRLTLNTGYSDYTFYDTAELARNNINLVEYTVGWQYKLGADTTLIGDYSWADLSDDNCRERLTLNLQRGKMWPGQGRMFYGLAYRYLNYSHDLNNGYWDPSNYHYSEVYADWFDMSNRKLRFDGGVGYGIDNADGQSSSTAFRYYAGVRAYPFGDRVVVKGGYRSSKAADTAASGPGYRSSEWYLTGVMNF